MPARRRPLHCLLASLLTTTAIASGGVLAAERPVGFPAQPVRLVVPFPPGGTSDIVGRVVAQKLGTTIGQRVVVENRPGAGAAIGIMAGVNAPADGQTLLLGAAGPLTMSPHMGKVPYDAERDLAPIALVTAVPNIVAVHPGVPAASLSELAALARKRPGNISYGSAGQGTTAHLSGELFRALAGVDMIHVPYKGTSAAVADLVGGQIDLVIDNLPGVLPQVRAGKLRALGVTTTRRSFALPDVPTIVEGGVAGYEHVQWTGFLAPAATPAAIINRLNAEAVRAVHSPELKPALASEGAEPVGNTPQQFAAIIRSETQRIAQVVRKAGIKAD